MKHSADRAKFYLFHAGPTYGIILLKMTHCVEGLSLLFQLDEISEKNKIQRIQ